MLTFLRNWKNQLTPSWWNFETFQQVNFIMVLLVRTILQQINLANKWVKNFNWRWLRWRNWFIKFIERYSRKISSLTKWFIINLFQFLIDFNLFHNFCIFEIFVKIFVSSLISLSKFIIKCLLKMAGVGMISIYDFQT